jgi:hypothetical protein
VQGLRILYYCLPEENSGAGQKQNQQKRLSSCIGQRSGFMHGVRAMRGQLPSRGHKNRKVKKFLIKVWRKKVNVRIGFDERQRGDERGGYKMRLPVLFRLSHHPSE